VGIPDLGVCGEHGDEEAAGVVTRWVSKDGTGGAEKRYELLHEANDGTHGVHESTAIEDPSGSGNKTWRFAQTGPAMGLLTSLEWWVYPGWAHIATESYTWVQQAESGNWYMGAVTTPARRCQIRTHTGRRRRGGICGTVWRSRR
jgi:hypothetical protein